MYAHLRILALIKKENKKANMNHFVVMCVNFLFRTISANMKYFDLARALNCNNAHARRTFEQNFIEHLNNTFTHSYDCLAYNCLCSQKERNR